MQERPVLAVTVAVVLSLYFAYFVIKDMEHGYISGATPVTMRQYSSEDGVSFQYPDTYRLGSAHHRVAGSNWDSVEFTSNTAGFPLAGESSESISLEVFDDSPGLSLEKYIKNDVRTNFKLSNGSLSPSTIGGEPAVLYQYSGPYQHDVVAVLHNNKVFIFSDSWMQTVEPIRHDFSGILSTVTFK